MGTSKESQRSGDEDDGEVIIPWAFVPYSVRRELITKLNPDVTMSGNDWRMLASELGYTTGEISFIESEKDNNTTLLFKHYDTKPGASLNDVYRSLEKMQRHDCLEVIKNALPEIHQAYNKSNESQTLHVADTSEMLASRPMYQWPGSPYACPCSHHPTAAFGSLPYYPCSPNFASCGRGAYHSPHMASCPSPYHVHLPPHPHHSACQSFSPLDTVQKTCEPGFSSPHHTSSAPPGYAMKLQPGSHGNIAQPMGSSSEAHQRSSPITVRCASGSQVPNQHFSPGHLGHHGSPSYSLIHNDQEDSMMIESDNQISQYRHIPSVQQHDSNLNSSIMAPTAMSDMPFRSQGHSLPLPNNISTVDNSNLFSSDSSNSDSFNNRQKVARQYSDECNATQMSSGDKRFRNTSSRDTLGSVDSIDQHGLASQAGSGQMGSGFRPQNSHNKCPKFVHPSDASALVDYRDRFYEQECEVKVRNESGVPEARCPPGVPNHGTCSEAKTSLAQLAKLATVPDKFKPTNEYTTVVAKQKIDIDKHNRDGKSSSDCPSHGSNGSSSARNHPSTFPMRVKVKHERGMEDIKNLTISKKSTSMPQNMKPVEYRKAFRHIKVFVTYSYDNESHGKQVLSLCKFLQSNGFACCVDVCEKKTSAKSLEQLEWCRKKVLEADFILVCISPRYLEEISPASSTLPQNSQRQLHTREIYELMNTEYLNNQHSYDGESNSGVTSPQRFVPLLFPKMTHSHVPAWMNNGPIYIWPQQYKDLAWMLTKPQERIRARKEASDEQFEER
ncbi:hypothetical protein BsWGS_19202 [Bradybaena similaris]